MTTTMTSSKKNKNKKKERKEKSDFKLNARRRRSVNIYGSKKPSFVKGSDNEASEIHVTDLYTPHSLLQTMTSYAATR